MSTCVDPYLYKTESLIADFQRDGVGDIDLLKQVLSKFGIFVGDYYLLINNELTDAGNPYYELANILNRVFEYKGAEESFFDTYLHSVNRRAITYQSASDVAEEMGIELEEGDG